MAYSAESYAVHTTNPFSTQPSSSYNDYNDDNDDNIPFDIVAADVPPSANVSGRAPMMNIGSEERILSGVAGAALAAYAVAKKRDLSGAALALAGGYLLYRGVTGYCPGYAALRTGTAPQTHADSPTAVIPHGQGIKVEHVMTINRNADELYDFWRNFENLPRIMAHLESVTVQDNTHSHWVAKAPLGKTVSWDAEIINEIPGEMIAWRSTGKADVPNAGSVRFKPAPAGRGTEVKVNLEYNPPAGLVGMAVAKLFGEEPNQQVMDDLRHFKALMEAGEIPTNAGQPTTGFTNEEIK